MLVLLCRSDLSDGPRSMIPDALVPLDQVEFRRVARPLAPDWVEASPSVGESLVPVSVTVSSGRLHVDWCALSFDEACLAEVRSYTRGRAAPRWLVSFPLRLVVSLRTPDGFLYTRRKADVMYPGAWQPGVVFDLTSSAVSDGGTDVCRLAMFSLFDLVGLTPDDAQLSGMSLSWCPGWSTNIYVEATASHALAGDVLSAFADSGAFLDAQLRPPGSRPATGVPGVPGVLDPAVALAPTRRR